VDNYQVRGVQEEEAGGGDADGRVCESGVGVPLSEAQVEGMLRGSFGSPSLTEAQVEGRLSIQKENAKAKRSKAIDKGEEFMICENCYTRWIKTSRTRHYLKVREDQVVIRREYCGVFWNATCTAAIEEGEIINEKGYVMVEVEGGKAKKSKPVVKKAVSVRKKVQRKVKLKAKVKEGGKKKKSAPAKKS